jgi:CsoR family transcriptional regulator, copper-sensing transcriptional repressor
MRRAHRGVGVVIHVTTIPLGGMIGRMPGYTKDKQKIETRLRRIEGQVRGIQKMVEEDRYCIDVLTQVNATRAALESVALQLLADHTEHCVAEAIRSGGGSKKVRELNAAVERLVRS